MAILAEARVFAANVAVIVPLPVPLAGFTVSHPELEEMVQLVFEVMENVVVPVPDPTFRLNGVTASRLIPLWLTVTNSGFTPVPETVIVPILAEASVLAEQVAVIVPFPLPLAGLTVSQLALEEIVQLVFELIVKVVIPDPDPRFRLNGVIDNMFIPLCVTVTGCGFTPAPDTVIVPILAEANALAV